MSTVLWAWDMQSMPKHPQSDAWVASLLRTTPAGWVGAVSAVAYRDVAKPSDYTCHGSAQNGLDGSFQVPAGTLPGMTTDRHLLVVDRVTGRTQDMWEAKLSGGKIVGASGGRGYASLPQVAYLPRMVKPGANTSTNASNVPTEPSLLTPADVWRGVADHTLRFVFRGPGPGNLYPAAPYAHYSGGVATNPPVAVGIRLPFDSVLPVGASVLEWVLFNSLRLHGAVGTDGGSDLAFKARDLGGGGQGAAEWAKVGVTMVPMGLGNSGSLYVKGHSAKLTLIPWHRLEVVKLS